MTKQEADLIYRLWEALGTAWRAANLNASAQDFLGHGMPPWERAFFEQAMVLAGHPEEITA